eukprot:CAMPEP_0115494034 /NCGR_PEP_ID=MMETSP0271-20121206/64505_1 /TAXON_ID=71861 /ORGANISM="Scrippsiella trochoidea, Strain CCMP3099" /LENGTH=416 /DNA_ID=CAMNT_0002922587 /DNA_START=27 /DNA_END=1278 /DNA_ORIENTATION=-
MPIASEVALPTLLCSRPNVATAPSKARRPIPVALDALDDIAGAPISPLRIKNTFLDGGVQLSPSLDRFYQAREVQTCPSKHYHGGGRWRGCPPHLALLSPERGNRAVEDAPPYPVALDALDEIAGAPISPLRIKNTFLDAGVQLSPSWDHFYHAREVQTCPSRNAGRLVDLSLERIPGDIPEEPTSPTATPLAIVTPCNMQTPVAEGALRVPGYQPWCSLSLEYPSYGHASQMSAPTEVLVGRVSVAPYSNLAPADSTPLLCEQGNYAPRAVLSLADALESEAMSVQQLSMMRPEIQPAPYADAQFAPLVPQPESAALDGWTLNLGAPSAPPPPPAQPALGTAELPSMGSSDHALGCCKPCAFLHTKGCQSGLACKFCHLCGPEERRRRRQEKQHERRELHRARSDKKTALAAVAQ